MSKYPASDDYTARVMRAAQLLKAADKEYFADVVRELVKDEFLKRKPHGHRRKKQMSVARNGVRVRGGRVKLNLDNPDIEVVPSQQSGRMEW